MSDFKNQQYTNKSKIMSVATKPSLNTKDVFALCKLNHDDDNNEIKLLTHFINRPNLSRPQIAIDNSASQ